MKVLDVTEFYSERGGGVRSHLTLKGHFSGQLGHEQVVLAPGPTDSDSGMTSEGKILRISGPSLPYDPTYHLLWRIDKIRARIAAERPDVLEIHSPYVAAMGALAASRSSFGIRTFFWHSDFIDTYRAVLARRVPAAAADPVLAPLWAWVRRIGRACSATIAASRGQAEKLRSHGVSNVVLLPFGVDKDIFRPLPAQGPEREQANDLRGRLVRGQKGPLLVGVGRFAVEKQWEVVIDAFLALRERTPATLVLYGDGPARGRLEARAKGAVQFPGFETDRHKLARALAGADALVHGCPFETFGIGVAEAIACGLPIVVPDQGGAAEQAGDAFAEVYRSGDAAACARAIERLLARDPAALRDAARQAALRVPSVLDHFKELYALYERLLAGRRD